MSPSDQNQPAPPDGEPPFNVAAVIYDDQTHDCDVECPNQANVLELPHGRSQVLAVVQVDELFLTYAQRGLMHKVRTLSGVEGYMDVAHIRMLSNGAALARHLGNVAS